MALSSSPANNGQRSVEWHAAILDGNQQALLSLLEQRQDADDILVGEACLGGDVLRAVSFIEQLLDTRQDFQRATLATGDVLGQAHDEGIFIVDINHQRRNGGFAQRTKSVEAAFTADQQIAFRPILSGARGDRNGFLDTDGLDVPDDVLENPFVAFGGFRMVVAVFAVVIGVAFQPSLLRSSLIVAVVRVGLPLCLFPAAVPLSLALV